jgi:hypothetical protein
MPGCGEDVGRKAWEEDVMDVNDDKLSLNFFYEKSWSDYDDRWFADNPDRNHRLRRAHDYSSLARSLGTPELLDLTLLRRVQPGYYMTISIAATKWLFITVQDQENTLRLIFDNIATGSPSGGKFDMFNMYCLLDGLVDQGQQQA